LAQLSKYSALFSKILRQSNIEKWLNDNCHVTDRTTTNGAICCICLDGHPTAQMEEEEVGGMILVADFQG